MAAAVDVHSGDIHYEYYINSLMVSPKAYMKHEALLVK